jgi:hypothetical protein
MSATVNAKKKRRPKKGDHVSARGQEGTYIVYDVEQALQAAELQQVGSDLRLSAIPWSSLTFLDKA